MVCTVFINNFAGHWNPPFPSHDVMMLYFGCPSASNVMTASIIEHPLITVYNATIADICHNRHNRRWCTLLEPVPFFPQRMQNFDLFWPIWAILLLVYAPFGVLLQGSIMWWCLKIDIYQVWTQSGNATPSNWMKDLPSHGITHATLFKRLSKNH